MRKWNNRFIKMGPNTPITHPFLKWAGGKSWLVKQIGNQIDVEKYTTYHEPFLGGGAILFHLHPNNAYVSDLNENLINCYVNVRDHVDMVVNILQQFRCSKDDYYRIRQDYSEDPIFQAARFIYLNKMSYNGIYRENRQGQYNVPFGYRDSLNVDYENLINVSKYLKKVHISSGDFADSLSNIEAGALVFLDPPYTVSHNNNGFIQYNQKIFAIEEQYRLAALIRQIKERGAFYILTNANHEKVKEIFNLGDRCIELNRASTIGGTNAQRGIYKECIFTNTNLFL